MSSVSSLVGAAQTAIASIRELASQIPDRIAVSSGEAPISVSGVKQQFGSVQVRDESRLQGAKTAASSAVTALAGIPASITAINARADAVLTKVGDLLPVDHASLYERLEGIGNRFTLDETLVEPHTFSAELSEGVDLTGHVETLIEKAAALVNEMPGDTNIAISSFVKPNKLFASKGNQLNFIGGDDGAEALSQFPDRSILVQAFSKADELIALSLQALAKVGVLTNTLEGISTEQVLNLVGSSDSATASVVAEARQLMGEVCSKVAQLGYPVPPGVFYKYTADVEANAAAAIAKNRMTHDIDKTKIVVDADSKRADIKMKAAGLIVQVTADMARAHQIAYEAANAFSRLHLDYAIAQFDAMGKVAEIAARKNELLVQNFDAKLRASRAVVEEMLIENQALQIESEETVAYYNATMKEASLRGELAKVQVDLVTAKIRAVQGQAEAIKIGVAAVTEQGKAALTEAEVFKVREEVASVAISNANEKLASAMKKAELLMRLVREGATLNSESSKAALDIQLAQGDAIKTKVSAMSGGLDAAKTGTDIFKTTVDAEMQLVNAEITKVEAEVRSIIQVAGLLNDATKAAWDRTSGNENARASALNGIASGMGNAANTFGNLAAEIEIS